MSEHKYRVAVMFAGDPSIRATVKLEETRLGNIAKALRSVGLDVEAEVNALTPAKRPAPRSQAIARCWH
jgi:hypothetical protein